MDNAGDWLYIVFLIVAGISSLLSSLKKKKRPAEILGQPGKDIVVREKETPQKGFWEILEEMQEQKPRPVEPQYVKPKKKKEMPAKAPSPFLTAESNYNKSTLAEGSPITMTPEEKEAFSDFEFDNAFELRKAVIYAEILNRKY